MLVNDGRILKNGNNIFKSQIVQSYLSFNSPYYSYVYLGVSGVTANNPLHMHYETPTGILKFDYTYDSTFGTYLPATNESSYKEFYFSGNLNAIFSISFNNQYYWSGNYYAGNLIKLMEQFTNLSSASFSMMDYYYYNQSIFNQDISNSTFPNKLKTFNLHDSTVSGKINTITNFEKIEDLKLISCGFTENITDLNFSNLRKLYLSYLNYLNGSINDAVLNNPNLTSLYIDTCNLFTGNATTLDVAQLNYIYLNIYSAPQITGDITNWTFNTGLTSISLYNQYLDGDITNWDFSNTHCTQIYMQNSSNLLPKIHGSLSGWTLPDTLQSMNFWYVTGITSMPTDFSNTALNTVYFYYSTQISQDLADINFGHHISQIVIYNSLVTGDVETYLMPSGVTIFSVEQSELTGNFSAMTFNNVVQQLYLDGNLLRGNITGVVFPNSLLYLNLGGNSGLTINLKSTPYVAGETVGVFHTNNVTYAYLDSISGITGNLSNFVFDTNIGQLTLNGTRVNCDLSKLNSKKIQQLTAYSCPNIYGDLTDWLTGTTVITNLDLRYNSLLSGNTTNWNVNNINYLYLNSTNLTGALKHNNIYYLDVSSTHISSNIETDLNFSNRAVTVLLPYCDSIVGNLSGVTLYYGIQEFKIYNSPNIYGSNAFIDYLFLNKMNFTYWYLQINISNVGDSVTGISETMGSMGTYAGNPQDLSEAQANNLATGLDYTGSGSNTPWDSKQKIWWMLNKKISSTNTNKKYAFYYISY